MKMAKLILTSTILLSLAFIVGCKDDDDAGLSEEDAQALKLANTWIMSDASSVKRDGTDLTSKFADFKLRFTTSGAYTVQEDPENVIFPVGTWKFVDGTINIINLNSDENPISVSFQENDGVLSLDFTVSEDNTIGGRVYGINGNYQFVLSKK